MNIPRYHEKGKLINSVLAFLQKQEKRRELRLKRFWRSPKTTSSEDSTGYESPTRTKAASAGGSSDAQRFNHLHYTSLSQGSGTSSSAGGATASGAGPTAAGPSGNNKPSCSLPLLQVWPSQVGTHFLFSLILGCGKKHVLKLGKKIFVAKEM